MKSSRIFLTVLALAGGILVHAADSKAEKAKPYPLDFCLVSDEKFEGSGMTPYEITVDGQTIKFCCKSCVKDFKKDSKKYLQKLADESKKQADKK